MGKWVLLILGILVSFYFYIKSVIDSITIKFGLDQLNDISLEGLSLSSLNRGTSFVKIRLKIIIKFFSLFDINIKDLNIQVFYNNKLIAKSTYNVIENTKSLNLIKNVDNTIYHTFDLQVNSTLVDLVYKVRNNIPYIIDYNIRLKIFGIPFNTTDSYNSIDK